MIKHKIRRGNGKYQGFFRQNNLAKVDRQELTEKSTGQISGARTFQVERLTCKRPRGDNGLGVFKK